MKQFFIILLLVILSSVDVEGKDNGATESTLPPWFTSALSDPEIYIGIAPPCDNPTAAKDMAIATAVLSYLFNSGDYRSNVKGFFKTFKTDSISYEVNYKGYADCMRFPSVQLSDIFYNENNECFVACKFILDQDVNIVRFYKRIELISTSDSLTEYTDFAMRIHIKDMDGNSLSSSFTDIGGGYKRIMGKGSTCISLRCSNADFATESIMEYQNATSLQPESGSKSIVTNLGTSYFKLITAFPQVSDSLTAIGSTYQYRLNEYNDAKFIAYELKGRTQKLDLRLSGIRNNKLIYSLLQKDVIERSYRHKIRNSIISKPVHEGYGVEVNLIIALAESILQLDGEYSDPSIDRLAPFYGKRIEQNGDFATQWLIGSTGPSSVTATVDPDTDTSCAVRILILE